MNIRVATATSYNLGLTTHTVHSYLHHPPCLSLFSLLAQNSQLPYDNLAAKALGTETGFVTSVNVKMNLTTHPNPQVFNGSNVR
jgi:hypothetical protein